MVHGATVAEVDVPFGEEVVVLVSSPKVVVHVHSVEVLDASVGVLGPRDTGEEH